VDKKVAERDNRFIRHLVNNDFSGTMYIMWRLEQIRTIVREAEKSTYGNRLRG